MLSLLFIIWRIIIRPILIQKSNDYNMIIWFLRNLWFAVGVGVFNANLLQISRDIDCKQ